MDIPYLQNKKRVLVQLAEDIAVDTPHRVYAVVPKTDNLENGFLEVTYHQAIKAVNYLGRWLKSALEGQPSRQFESLAYVGVADLRYTLLTLACIKCGYKLLLPSPRNSIAVNLSLMKQVNCSKILFSSELGNLVKSYVSASLGLKAVQVPAFAEVLAGEAEPIPYEPTFEEALNHPVVVLHSSGSTGDPKPVVFTNGSIATLGADWDFEVPAGRKVVGLPLFVSDGGECRYFGPMPPFHLGGLYYRTIAPIYSLAVPIYSPATRLPSSELVLEILQHQKVHALVLPPSIIEGLLHVPSGLDCLKNLNWIMFSGGPLSQSVGDQIRKYTTLTPYYGSTELLAIRQITPEPDNWSYHEFHPDDNFRMEHFDGDVYELVAVPDPKAGPGNPGSAAFVHSLPGATIYRTKDLFKKHPERDLWRFSGRKDDIIVLSTGEKINPEQFEKELKGDSVIADALLIGSGRTRPALLVEPKDQHREELDLLDRIWNAVKRVNLTVSGPSHVSRELILVTDPKRPFLRSPKGSVIRGTTIRAYEQDVQALYSSIGVGSISNMAFDIDRCSLAQVQDVVRAAVANVTSTTPLDDSCNLYLLGMDSLQTADAISSLGRLIGKQPWLVPNLCYSNPSVKDLAYAIFARLQSVDLQSSQSRQKRLEATRDRMMAGYPAEHAGQLPSGNSQVAAVGRKVYGLKVAITGTTGTLGSLLTELLLESAVVSEIVCLNRSEQAQAKWHQRSSSAQFTGKSLQFFTVNYTKRQLGLSKDDIHKIETCDFIIHNAWRVDFNLDLSSFEDNLSGLRNILDICEQAHVPPNLVFVSSISSVSSFPNAPEHVVDDVNACAPMGYAESKFVAERMLDQAVQRSPRVKATVLRVGQIAASRTPGAAPWPENEAIPGIVRTSKSLRLIPVDLPAVNWIPIDEVGRCILELSLGERSDQQSVVYYNLTNPHLTSWEALLGPLRDYCGEEARTVSMQEWSQALARFDCADKIQLADKPALKVVSFIQHLADNADHESSKIQIDAAVSHSASLATVKPIDQEAFGLWLSQL